MADADIWRCAHLLIKLHGDDAGFVAAQRAGAMLDEGDREGCSIWITIGRAIGELQRQKPHEGEALN